MAELSSKQQKILNYIKTYLKAQGYPPTLREICKEFSISSTNGARYHLHRLQKMGYLEIDPHRSRGVKCVEQEDENSSPKPKVFQMPVLGSVPAGPFDMASPDLREGELTINPAFFGSNVAEPEMFGLRVKGDSMINAGIHDGDIVVVKAQGDANNGDIVVARLEEEATVKRYRKESRQIVLEPENPAYASIPIRDEGGADQGQDVSLLGVVVGLIRSM
jgi:repressor LexA